MKNHLEEVIPLIYGHGQSALEKADLGIDTYDFDPFTKT